MDVKVFGRPAEEPALMGGLAGLVREEHLRLSAAELKKARQKGPEHTKCPVVSIHQIRAQHIVIGPIGGLCCNDFRRQLFSPEDELCCMVHVRKQKSCLRLISLSLSSSIIS